MAVIQYVPLHAHDTYGSIGDSILKIPDYVKKAKELGINALALTNHGSLSTFVNFYEECNRNGIKPIIGCELYLCDDRLIHDKSMRQYYHLILLAKDYTGLTNLIRIHNDSHRNGFYYKPRTDLSVLREYKEGLICLTACVASPIAQLYFEDDMDKLSYYVTNLKEIFGSDLYFEIQPGSFKEQIDYNNLLVNLSNKLGIELVATNDIHYLDKNEAEIHDYHVKDSRKQLAEEKRIYPDDCYYLMDYKELYNSFIKTKALTSDLIIKAIDNTNIVADKCNLKLPEDKFMPRYSLITIDENMILRELCYKAFEAKQYTKDYDKRFKRLEYELNTIQTLGFSGYFLIVKDFIDFCDQNNIARGPGRGSAAGSFVSYLLGISIADPVKYDLMFERFLSVHRTGWPDIDIDISGSQRELVYQHIKDRYGEDHCCFISTTNMRKARNAIKTAARLIHMDASISNEISKLIPYVYYDDDCEKHTDVSIKEAYENVPEFKKIADQYPLLIGLAIKLEGYPSSMGIHPAGIVISPVSIWDRYPLIRCKNEMLMATSLDLKDVEKLSGVKFDLLALSSLSAIKDTLNQAGIEFDYSNEELLSDPKVWKLISSKKSAGLFQISSNIYKTRMPQLNPRNIKELANCLALVRGPCISSGADKKYIEIVQGKKKSEKLHDIYWEATKDTFGILIYQEQILKVCMNIGFDSESAYKILKAVSKKKIDLISSYKNQFYKLGQNKNIDLDVLNRIWDEIERAGLYAFNTAHAVSYALLCYCSAWLKTYYPLQYMANLLSKEYMKTLDKTTLNNILDECKDMKIKFLPPDINKSQWDFTVEDNKLRIGFCAIKGIGEAAYKHLKSLGTIENMDSLINNSDFSGRIINKKIMSILIATGMFGQDIASLSEYYIKTIRKEKEWDGIIKFGLNQKVNVTKTDYRKICAYILGSNKYFS